MLREHNTRDTSIVAASVGAAAAAQRRRKEPAFDNRNENCCSLRSAKSGYETPAAAGVSVQYVGGYFPATLGHGKGVKSEWAAGERGIFSLHPEGLDVLLPATTTPREPQSTTTCRMCEYFPSGKSLFLKATASVFN